MKRNINNTRLRGFYNLHHLFKLHSALLNQDILATAIYKTAAKRDSLICITEKAEKNLPEIKASSELRFLWKKYTIADSSAKEITYEDLIETLKKINSIIKASPLTGRPD